MHETFETPGYLIERGTMGVQYSDVTGQWNVKGKRRTGEMRLSMTYGKQAGQMLTEF